MGEVNWGLPLSVCLDAKLWLAAKLFGGNVQLHHSGNAMDGRIGNCFTIRRNQALSCSNFREGRKGTKGKQDAASLFTVLGGRKSKRRCNAF